MRKPNDREKELMRNALDGLNKDIQVLASENISQACDHHKTPYETVVGTFKTNMNVMQLVLDGLLEKRER